MKTLVRIRGSIVPLSKITELFKKGKAVFCKVIKGERCAICFRKTLPNKIGHKTCKECDKENSLIMTKIKPNPNFSKSMKVTPLQSPRESPNKVNNTLNKPRGLSPTKQIQQKRMSICADAINSLVLTEKIDFKKKKQELLSSPVLGRRTNERNAVIS